MKKLFLMAVLLSFCGIALAQHYDYVDQWGNQNISLVTQQTDEPYEYYGNSAIVYQWGDLNNSTVYQFNVAEWEDGNEALVYQYGHLNIADVEQIVAGNDATIFQSGNQNDASTQQIGEWNTSLTEQYGYVNISRVSIYGFLNNTYNLQSGWGNFSEQYMGSTTDMESVALSTFLAYQIGDYNYAYQLAVGDGTLNYSLHFDNYGEINQWGDYNQAVNLINGSWNTSYQYQAANSNYSFHWNDGDGNLSTTYQNW
jgi:minor curlin subunit